MFDEVGDGQWTLTSYWLDAAGNVVFTGEPIAFTETGRNDTQVDLSGENGDAYILQVGNLFLNRVYATTGNFISSS